MFNVCDVYVCKCAGTRSCMCMQKPEMGSLPTQALFPWVRTFFRSVGFVLLRYGILLAQAVIFPGWKPLCGSPHSFLNCFRVQGGTSFRVLPFGA